MTGHWFKFTENSRVAECLTCGWKSAVQESSTAAAEAGLLHGKMARAPESESERAHIDLSRAVHDVEGVISTLLGLPLGYYDTDSMAAAESLLRALKKHDESVLWRSRTGMSIHSYGAAIDVPDSTHLD